MYVKELCSTTYLEYVYWWELTRRLISTHNCHKIQVYNLIY